MGVVGASGFLEVMEGLKEGNDGVAVGGGAVKVLLVELFNPGGWHGVDNEVFDLEFTVGGEGTSGKRQT